MDKNEALKKINSRLIVEYFLFAITIIDTLIYAYSASVAKGPFFGSQGNGWFGVAIISMVLTIPLTIISCVITPIIVRVISKKEFKVLDKKTQNIAELKIAVPTIALVLMIFGAIILAVLNQ